jgi:hypothetical protein
MSRDFEKPVWTLWETINFIAFGIAREEGGRKWRRIQGSKADDNDEMSCFFKALTSISISACDGKISPVARPNHGGHTDIPRNDWLKTPGASFNPEPLHERLHTIDPIGDSGCGELVTHRGVTWRDFRFDPTEIISVYRPELLPPEEPPSPEPESERQKPEPRNLFAINVVVNVPMAEKRRKAPAKTITSEQPPHPDIPKNSVTIKRRREAYKAVRLAFERGGTNSHGEYNYSRSKAGQEACRYWNVEREDEKKKHKKDGTVIVRKAKSGPGLLIDYDRYLKYLKAIGYPEPETLE